jgi:pimeloyl-ACP methyl ester carboxylesterase
MSLDPRGTGGSRALRCKFELPDPPAPEADDATLIAWLDDYSRLVAAQCLDEDPEFVRSISGHNFARDIEQLRIALGERQLSFAMASNSGPVAALYASLFPTRVRAMIVDAPVAAEHRDYWLERRTEQGDSYERTLQRTDHICRRHPECPLRTIGVVNAFDQVRADLDAQPIPLPNGAAFDGEAFADTFFELLPVEELWNPMVGALAQALNGDPSPFIGLFLSAGGGDDGIVARLCNDYGTRRTARDYLPLVEAVGAVHPRFFDRDQLLGDAALCAAWPPADPPAITPSAAHLEVPVLTLHAQFDSDAPFAWGPRLAHAMGDDRHVVRYLGGGHGVIQRQQPCVRDTVNAYLFDLQLPKEGLACPAEVGPPAAGAFASPSLARPLGGFAQSEAPVRLKRQRR